MSACHLLRVIWQSFQGLVTIGMPMDKKHFIPVLEAEENVLLLNRPDALNEMFDGIAVVMCNGFICSVKTP